MWDDADLLNAYAEKRSEAAFAELVRRHVDLVYSAALRRVGGDSHLAEDVSQKVFVALARQASVLSSRATLTGWLYTASRFAAVQVVRTERRRRRREQEDLIMKEILADSASAPDWDQLRPILDEVMDQLKERDREALLLRFFEERPFAEMSRALHLSEDAARRRVDRALERLRALLAKRGVRSTSAAVSLLLASHTVSAAPAGLSASVTGAALAAGGVGAAPLAYFLHLMSTSKIVAGIGGLLLILALGIGTHEVFAHRAAERSLVAANQDYDAQMAKQRELERRLQAAEQDATELKRTVDEAHAVQTASEARLAKEAQTAKEAAAWDPSAEGKAFMARHPEVRERLIEYQNARLDFRFGSLYKSRGFTGDQIEEFRTLMRESSVQSWPVGTSGKFIALGAGTDLSADEIKSRLNALLGDDGSREMTKISGTAARDLAVKVAALLSFTNAPLTTPQSVELVQIVADHTTQSRVAGRSIDWESVMSKAQNVLSAPQLNALEAVRAEDLINRARYRRVPDSSQGGKSAK